MMTITAGINFQTYGSPRPMGYPGCWNPTPWNWNQGHGNLPNANVGQHGFLGLCNTRGYGLDLNNDGRYTRGQDAVLAMDLNRDGKITPQEIQESRQRLNAMGGNFDLNGDGKVSFCERMKGQQYQQQMRCHDRNHDGRLDASEFAGAGGRVGAAGRSGAPRAQEPAEEGHHAPDSPPSGRGCVRRPHEGAF